MTNRKSASTVKDAETRASRRQVPENESGKSAVPAKPKDSATGSSGSKKASIQGAWRPIEGGVTAPEGYMASGIAAGVKKQGPDVAVVFSTQPAVAAGVFTKNLVQAAPVVLSRENLKLSRGRARAILINSGCANACT
ncbi:MAG: bifunctional ornithine acetyltransferase/N-acetylglutamate synthase, partial [Acidobacteriota bacterium]|nr:bifunctional ornithine acetyltransferase/N-acetylglutamate synthase [Acidobacteriota bacterium]